MSVTEVEQSLKLNIGSGETELPGFTNIDRRDGKEAYPLEYETDSVDEIRASHILEHFSFREAISVLEEWVRVLKPGGLIRIAVPDVDKCLKSNHKNRLFYLMGGQTDENDFHKSAWDENRLRSYMELAGLGSIESWESDGLDTSAHEVSLNLQGRKLAEDEVTEQKHLDVKIGAYMTLPRYEAVAARSTIESSCRELGIGLATSQGVFWGQCMQRMFNDAIEQGVEWILSIDSDSMFNTGHLEKLLQQFAQTPEADAMAALQCRRGKGFPLMTIEGQTSQTISDKKPFRVTTAHFGLTLIRVSALKEVAKPWFFSRPDSDGEYGDDRLDDDIWFWHQWKEAGKSIYVAPDVSIGHLEETVAIFDDDLNPRIEYLNEWREKNLNRRQYSF